MAKIGVVHLLFFILLTGSSYPVLAWGARGHRIVASLAEQQLTPKTRAAISAILGAEDLPSAATWADEMRGSTDNPRFWLDYASAWHFVNLPANGNYDQSTKNPQGDAVIAMATFTAILLDQPLPAGPAQTGLRHYFGATDLHDAKVKRFALKFLIHIVGDLHQPLHSGYASDHGGNDIKLVWQHKQTNLHALWDSVLLDHGHLSETDYIARLGSHIQRMPKADIARMQGTDVKLWLQESSDLLRHIHAGQPQTATLDEHSYSAEFTPTIENQLVKAAVRTGWVLNKLFEGEPAATR